MNKIDLFVLIFAFLGALVGGVISFLGELTITKKNELNEKTKKRYKNICKQFQTFCKLEELYIEEIIELRKALNKENKPKGVKDEFRNKVYKDSECARIEYNQSSIQVFFDL